MAGGVDWVQLRDRALGAAALLELAERLRAAIRRAEARTGARARFLVNRRIDVALALRAEGVHLGGDAVPVPVARGLLPSGAIVGVSTHAAGEVAAAKRAGASYAHLAPIFPPISKAGSRPPLGLDALREARWAGIPVLAQGGIDPERAAGAVAAGASGVAVTGTILGSAQPGEMAAALRAALDEAARRTAPC